jgi:hypothetical protein
MDDHHFSYFTMLATKDSHHHYQEQTLSSVSISINGFIITSVNPVHHAPHLFVMESGVQVDRARREGEICYKQTPPGTPGFRSTGPGVGVREGKVCYKQTWARHSRIST